MLAGVATRGQVDVAEPLSGDLEAKAKATGRSGSVALVVVSLW
jgi:hypothetical protein